MKRLLSLVAAMMLVVSMLAPAAVAEAKDNWLHIFYTDNPETLDVQKTTDSYTIPLNCFDRLVETDTVDGEAQIVPGLADSWEISEDGLTYTFHLHEGVTFQNGDPFTADDVVYTVTRMMDPNDTKKNTDIFDVIVGANAYREGTADAIEGVVAVDDLTVQFTLENAYAPFLSCLATPGGSIYNRESTEGVDDFGENPAVCFGTGPFEVTEWELGSKVTLVSNPNYFKGAPQIDGIVMHIVSDADTQRMMFEQGEVDVFNFDYAESQLQWFLDNGYEDQIVSGSRAGTYYFMFNTDIEPLNDANVRKALQMAVDRQAILDALYSGEGKVLSCFIPEGVLSHDPDAPEIPYDPEQAKALLAEAGYADGFNMEIAVMADSTTSQQVSSILASYWQAIGVNAEVKQYDEATYYDIRRDGKLPSYYNSWSADFNDPDNFLYTFFSRKNTVGRSVNYDNEEILQLLDDARVMVDFDERMAAYQKIDNAVVHDDAITLPLYQRNHLFCLNPRVHGFKVAWNGWSDMSFYTISLGD
ncbi:MAG: ABC transporter substrate-binding protein [Clostridia bacterium]|nr:ABC transporter substrate-binding protein [Clostridia bacterium]